MTFKPSKDEILQAWDDLESGKPISKEMSAYLKQLEQRELENSATADETGKWARREAQTNKSLEVWDRIHQNAQGSPIPEDAREELRRIVRKGV